MGERLKAFRTRVLQGLAMYVFTREYSILGGILSLFEDGQTLLGAILLLFSVVFPLAKNLLALFCILILERRPKRVRQIVSVIGQLSKWSMDRRMNWKKFWKKQKACRCFKNKLCGLPLKRPNSPPARPMCFLPLAVTPSFPAHQIPDQNLTS